MSYDDQIDANNIPPTTPPHVVQQDDPPPTFRARKTHRNHEVTTSLRNLTHGDVQVLNNGINQRNAQRAYRRAVSNADPRGTDDPISDDSSVITMPDEPVEDSPEQQLSRILREIPRDDLTRILSTLGKRKERSPSPEHSRPLSPNLSSPSRSPSPYPPPKKSAKCTPHSELRILEEKVVKPGLSLDLGFDHIFHDLDNNRRYLPLSLFTDENLQYINRHSSTIELKKHFLKDKSGNPYNAYLIDIAKFEKTHGSETSLSYPDWINAWRNFLRWVRSRDPEGPNGRWSKRWEKHYEWLVARRNVAARFRAILALDIELRTNYANLPFAFCPFLYSETFQDILNNTPDAPTSQPSSSSSRTTSSSRSFFPSSSFRSQSTPSRSFSSSSFRSSSTRSPSKPDSCLICTRRGHRFSACVAKSFPDGKPLHSKFDNNQFRLAKSNKELCSTWNIHGPAASCSHDNKRTHACSFCGDHQHHAFSWTCQTDTTRV